jgi:hypothetical protein
MLNTNKSETRKNIRFIAVSKLVSGAFAQLLSFALIIGNSANPIPECHSGEILFQSSTVLNNKQDASSMTFSLLLLQTSLNPL